jgi:methyltransferase
LRPLPPPGLSVALAGFVLLIVVERIAELRLSSMNARRLVARGGVEHGRGHFPAFVVLHTLFPIALVAEVWLLGARPGPLWPLWALLFLAAQALRFAAIRALGEHWNVRVWVTPGMERVRRGPYRFLKHPNYLAVALELVTAPMMFGAWRTALLTTVINLTLLGIRLPVEERALRDASERII